MRRTVIALCVFALALPANALAAGSEAPSLQAVRQAATTGADGVNAETSANGLGWKQFVTGSGGGATALTPELASWALMVGAIGLAGSLLRRRPARKT